MITASRSLRSSIGAIVAGRLRGVAFLFLDAFGGFAGVVVVDVGDGDDLDVGLLEERIEELIAPAARADQAEPDLLVGRRGRRSPGAPSRAPAPAVIPTVSTKSAPRDPIGRHGWFTFLGSIWVNVRSACVLADDGKPARS